MVTFYNISSNFSDIHQKFDLNLFNFISKFICTRRYIVDVSILQKIFDESYKNLCRTKMYNKFLNSRKLIARKWSYKMHYLKLNIVKIKN